MGVWDQYDARMTLTGRTKRDAAKVKVTGFISRKLPHSLSYDTVDFNGAVQSLAIMDTSKAYIKEIHSLPGESFDCGTVLSWSDYHWLITDVDARSEFYVSGTMRQCNYVLKWVNEGGKIVERYCILEDGTKYLIGEKSSDIMTVGDARVALFIGKDSETLAINRGHRFLIDDPDSTGVLAYEVTKPNKLYGLYNGIGVYKHILTETNITDDDNLHLMIADYYKHWPSERPVQPPGAGGGGQEGWL